MELRTSDFDFDLPDELIAADPPPERGASRLLVVNRESGQVSDSTFAQLGDYLRPGDLLVVNDSRVLRARLRGKRVSTGGGVELLLLKREGGADGRDTWSALARPARKLPMGEKVSFGDGRLSAEVIDVREEGERVLAFDTNDLIPHLDLLGEMPLPPYILQRRKQLGEEAEDAADAERYQTVYARDSGSVAAPTAGLHFTQEQLLALEERGIQRAQVTLHVGAGTFKPVEVDDPKGHPMHTETFTISAEAAAAINTACAEGRRVVAVGTTVVRTLESAADEEGNLTPGSGSTRLLILPGYRFKIVDALVTNFHLPRSTLLMLVSAFAGTDLTREAYATAIENRYRFYSYGDAMLIE